MLAAAKSPVIIAEYAGRDPSAFDALVDCSDYLFFGPNGMILRLKPRDEPYVFPVAIPISSVEILNENLISGCGANIDATGY